MSNIMNIESMNKTQTRVAYKVVNSLLWSSRSGSVQYKVNEWVDAPGNTRLFVFDTLHEAKNFRNDNEKIYECYVKGGIKYFGSLCAYNNKVFWYEFNRSLQRKKKVQIKNVELTDIEALLVKSVKLIREITK